ncbi:MAG: DUF4870 domain-containing protein [Fidelibacterota bacterium]|nr:MAG: DUF4870 domain-containing protein [Candidatus Neomarinimicrobiota bacterium]
MTDEAPEISSPSRETRKWAMLCHLSALTGILGNGLGFLVGPLVVWLFKKEDDPFIDDQGKEAVNFQITMFIALLVSGFLVLVLIGFVLLVVVGIMMIVFPIIAAMKANEGELYRYPFSIRFIT